MDPLYEDEQKIDRLRRAMYSRTLSEKLKDKERRELEPTQDMVGNDWRRREAPLPGAVVAPRTIQLVRATLWWFLGIAIIFFVSAAGFFSYYFFLGTGSAPASPSNINIVVTGPPSVASGEATELQVTITNRNRVSLELADLVFTFPDGTREVTDYETAKPSLRQSLGTIGSGETRQGVVNVVFSGSEGQKADIKVELEYHLNGSNAVFVASNDYGFSFGTAPLSIAVDGNTQTISGQPVQMVVTIASNSNAPVRDALLQVNYPFGFKFTRADPTPTQNGLWKLGDINPGEKRTVLINGMILGDQGDDKVFNFIAGTRASTTTQMITTPLASNPFHVTVTQTFLGLAVTINSAATSSVVLQPGDNARVTIAYQNNLDTPIGNAVVVAKLSGIPIDGTTVRAADGFYRSSDNVVLWDKNTSGGVLGNLAPGAKGTLSFSFHVPDSSVLQNAANPQITISINAAGVRLSETGVPQNLQSSATAHIALASDLQLFAQGLYYQSPFGASGPMPPSANRETTYAIVFTIRNTTSPITNAKVTAVLPVYVRWVGSWAPAAENLSFNQTNSTFTWDVGDIGANVGLNGNSPRQLAINVGLTPSTSQIGQVPILMQDIVLTGIDASTGQKVERIISQNVTTNLAQVVGSTGDKQGSGLGTDHGFDPANATVVK